MNSLMIDSACAMVPEPVPWCLSMCACVLAFLRVCVCVCVCVREGVCGRKGKQLRSRKALLHVLTEVYGITGQWGPAV